MNSEYVLGIDIGTTSVKVCIINYNLDIVEEKSEPTEADITHSSYSSEQDAVKIIDTLQRCMSHFDVHLLNKVSAIGVSGQVHGIVFWNSKNVPWKITSSTEGNEIYYLTEPVSHLYTWQDGRCNSEFLSTLPKPDSHLKAYTGYGNNTLFWLHRNEPTTIAQYDTAGTIADLVVCSLCNSKRPLMSTQNAASWGYFNCQKCEWNTDILKRNDFPIHFLPTVVQPEEIAGTLAYNWYNVPRGIPVTVALADLQCSVMAVLEKPSDAFMNISTSGQLAFVHADFNPELDKNFPVEYVIPHFNRQYLIVAALLNGGNSLATFISSVKRWFEDLGFNQPLEYFWERISQLSNNTKINEVTMKADPLFFGERFATDERASISNITPENFQLGQMFCAICRGIILNFYKLIPREMLLDAGINRIIGSGNALIRNTRLQEEIERSYKLPLELKTGRDSAVGAAIAAISALKRRQG